MGQVGRGLCLHLKFLLAPLEDRRGRGPHWKIDGKDFFISFVLVHPEES